MYSFCIEEQKGLAYHCEGLRVPLVVRIPQFGNHRATKSIIGSKNSDSSLDSNENFSEIFWLLYLWCHSQKHKNQKKFFRLQTRRLAKSFEGLNSSLAQLVDELWHW